MTVKQMWSMPTPHKVSRRPNAAQCPTIPDDEPVQQRIPARQITYWQNLYAVMHKAGAARQQSLLNKDKIDMLTKINEATK